MRGLSPRARGLRGSIADLMLLVLLAGVASWAWRSPGYRATLIPGAIAMTIAGAGLLFARAGVTIGRVAGLGAAILAVPAVVAAGVSQSLWGYPIERPGLDRRIAEAVSIETITYVKTVADRKGVRTFARQPTAWALEGLGLSRTHPNFDLETRVLISIKDRGLLAPHPQPIFAGEFAALYARLAASGRLDPDRPSFPPGREPKGFFSQKDSRQPRDLIGILVEATGSDGLPLLFAGVRGGEVSEDRIPYYEFLYRGDAAKPGPLLSSRRFYYSVEEAWFPARDWPSLFGRYSAPTLGLAVPIAAVAATIRRRRSGQVAPPPAPDQSSSGGG